MLDTTAAEIVQMSLLGAFWSLLRHLGALLGNNLMPQCPLGSMPFRLQSGGHRCREKWIQEIWKAYTPYKA